MYKLVIRKMLIRIQIIINKSRLHSMIKSPIIVDNTYIIEIIILGSREFLQL